MTRDIELFIAIAEIAGVFVGFGALISLTRKNAIDFPQLGRLRGVVSVALVVIVAALIPVGISRYGITGHDFWLVCSVIFLFLVWAQILLSLSKSEYRELLTKQTRVNPLVSMFFWLLLEAPIHVSLVLAIIGIYPDLEPAFYTTALLFHLFEATFLLVRPNANSQDHEESHVLVH
jgi:L-asparagine transporter-like permease